MSNYMKITETEVLSVTDHVKDCEVEALKEKVLLQMKQEEYQMKSRNKNNGKMMKRVAAAIVVLGIAAPTGVYAAGKLGVFGGLFGDKDTASIEQYVENANTEQGEATAVYQMETDDYCITVDRFVYSEATDYGIVQFTLTDKNAEDESWYEVATWDEHYSDWKVWDTTEIFAGVGDGRLSFQVEGLSWQNNRCYMKQTDAQTYECYLCFNDMKKSNMADKTLKLAVKESDLVDEKLNWTQIMKLDVPKGESLPHYTWFNEDGETALVLTGVDFWLIDAPKSAVSGDIILKEISVQMKDGSTYVVQSEAQKTIDWFYSTKKETGIWRNFASVIDLEEVVSFTVDGKVFCVEDAVK